MDWQFSIQLLPIFLCIIIFVFMLRYAWQQRTAPGGREFGMVVVAVLLWTVSYAMEIANISLPAKIFWTKVQYLGILFAPAFWLIFMLRYTKRDHMVNKLSMSLLFAPLLFFLTMVWTNEQHQMIWIKTNLDPTGIFREPVFGQGFYFLLAFQYGLTLLAAAVLLNNLSRAPGVYRKQGAMLLVATFAPVLASLITVSDFNPFAPLDLTPISFIISGAAWLYGRTRLRLMDMLPVARAALLEKLADGVMVLDDQNRILDLNQAAQHFLSVSARYTIGRTLGDLLPQVAEQLPAAADNLDVQLEIELAGGKMFDANLIALQNQEGAFYGRILTLHDITASKQTQAELHRYAERLQMAQEIDRATLSRKNPDEIAETALQHLRQLLPNVKRASVLIFDYEAKQAAILAVNTQADTELSSQQKVPLASLPMLDELSQDHIFAVNDVNDPAFDTPTTRKLAQEGIQSFINLPLLVQTELIGSLNFGSDKVNAFTNTNVEMAREIANSLAIAIHQSQLSEQARRQTEQLQQRERYLTRLNEITRTAVSQLDSQAMLQTLADSMLGFEDADNCYITLYDENRRAATFTAVSGQEQPSFAAIQAKPGQVLLIESVLKAEHPLPIFDVHHTPHVSPEIAAKFPSQSVLALPLIVGQQKLGAVVVAYNSPHHFSEDEIQYGAQAAAQISLALSKAQLLENEREQRKLAEMLQETGAALSTTLDVNSLLERLLDQVQRLIPHDRAAVMLVKNGRVTISNHRGFNTINDAEMARKIDALNFSLDDTPNLKRMVEDGRPLIIPDVRDFPGWIATEFTRPVRSWAGAPIFQAGEISAFFSVDKAEIDFYQPWHASRLAALANQTSLALENARLYEEARRQLDELMVLHEIAAVGNEAMSVDDLVDQATEIITKAFYPHNFGFVFLEKDTGYLHPHFSYRVNREYKELISVPPNAGLIGRVIASGRPVRVDDVQLDESYIQADARTRAEVCVPLKEGKQVIGVINAESPEVGAFSAADERFLLTLARQLSTAIEKIHLLESERTRRQEEERLRTAISNISDTLELEQVLDSILVQVGRVVPFDSAAVFLLQGDRVCLVAGRGFPKDVQVIGSYYPRSNPLVAAIEKNKQPLYLADAQADGRFNSWGGANYIRGWLGVPLVAHGIVIGLLTLDSRSVNAYGETETVLVQAFSHQAAAAIENARLYEAEQKARNLADTLRDANQALTQSLDPQIVGSSLLDRLQQLIPYDSAALMLIQENDQVVMHTMRGFERFTDETAVQNITFDLTNNHSMHTVIQSGKSLLLPDTRNYDKWERRPETAYVRSWLGVPLIAGGKPIGLFSLDKAEPHFFDETHQKLAESLAVQTAIALQNAQLFYETRLRAEELTQASEIFLKLNATPKVVEVFPQLAQILEQITGCNRSSLTIIDADRRGATMMALDQPRQTYGKGVPIQFAETAAAEDVLSGVVHLTDDLEDEIEFTDAKLFLQAGYGSRINFPLLVGAEVTGSLNLAWKMRHGPNPAQIPLLKQIANAVALAMERSRLFDEINRQARQLGLLNQLSQQVTRQLDSQELYTTVVQTLHQSLDYARVSIFTVDTAVPAIVLRALSGPDDTVHWVESGVYQQEMGEGLIGQAAIAGKKILVNDTREHPDFLKSANFPVRSELALPLKVGDQVIGVLNLDHDEYNAFSEGDVTILSVVADQLAVSLEKARLIEETRHRAGELEILAEISASLRAANSVEVIVETLLSKVGFGEQTVRALFLLDRETETLMARGSYPPIPGFEGGAHRLDEGITGKVALTGKVHLSEKLADDPVASFLPEEKETLAEVYGSAALPLRAEERVVGVLHVAWLVPRQFTPDEVHLLMAVCEIAGSALHRAQLMDTLEKRVLERTRELAEANVQLQELDKLKSRFVADVSHELRTPITNVKLYLDLLAQGNEERREHYLSVLNKQSDRLVNLLEDILNLSRLELGSGNVEMTQVNFNDIVQQVVMAHAPRVEAASLKLQIDLQDNLPLIIGEWNQLAQVVTNLLVNAINYTPEGEIQVKTYRIKGQHEICLEINDTGIGVDPEDQAYLFDRFYRGKHASQSNIPGTGLGLAIVKEIITLHNGRIDMSPRPQGGTSVKVCLPSPL